MGDLAMRLTEVIDAYDGHLLPRDVLVLETVRDNIARVERECGEARAANIRLRKTPQKAELQARVALLEQRLADIKAALEEPRAPRADADELLTRCWRLATPERARGGRR